MKTVSKVIAIDIGGVCVQLHFKEFCEQLGVDWLDGSLSAEVQSIFNKFECGLCSEREWLDDLHKVSGHKFSDDKLIEIWNTIIGHDIEGMADVVREIVDLGYRFVFFSDTNLPHTHSINEKLSFSHLIEGAVFSFNVGAHKPDTSMFEAFENEFGKPCFYLDDKLMNIEGGTEYGWTSHHFKNAQGFRDEFIKQLEDAPML